MLSSKLPADTVCKSQLKWLNRPEAMVVHYEKPDRIMYGCQEPSEPPHCLLFIYHLNAVKFENCTSHKMPLQTEA